EYGISEDFYQKKDLHIHAPEGAVPKDGPSAGVTMATALISALSGIPVRADVAMTGEITLHGKVMPIGGLREKSMAAYKAGIRTVVIPAENQADLEEIDEIVKNQIEFIPVQNLSEVFAVALKKPAEKSSGKKKGKKKKHAEIPEISEQQIVPV
ncbi:MAG: endopeptidase La, partial [Oscillospiraceae bacterium]|nr:endopeptidase La [Oscillospiraceae bacterium]